MDATRELYHYLGISNPKAAETKYKRTCLMTTIQNIFAIAILVLGALALGKTFSSTTAGVLLITTTLFTACAITVLNRKVDWKVLVLALGLIALAFLTIFDKVPQYGSGIAMMGVSLALFVKTCRKWTGDAREVYGFYKRGEKLFDVLVEDLDDPTASFISNAMEKANKKLAEESQGAASSAESTDSARMEIHEDLSALDRVQQSTGAYKSRARRSKTPTKN